MRVLIVGSNGMLGQELIRAFTGADVVGWDRADLDITDSDVVRARMAAVAPDVCINATAYNAVDCAEEDAALAVTVNGSAVGVLAAAAADSGAVFVHYSTDYIFDGTSRDGYSEDAIPNPINAYGRSKLAGERALREVAGVHPAWRWHLIRTSRLFGLQGSSASGKRSFVDTMVALSTTKDRLEIVDEEIASPTYAPDLAAATREMIERALPSGIYHRTNTGSCTWYGFAQEIFTRIGWRGTLVPVSASTYPRPAKRPAYSVLRSTKIPPMRRWEDALAEYLCGMTKSE
ncbi:MAG: dTDP-4-dehydrorhamnose reductase [bacterium]|nr:dTDP-4-dehydrorhamnose reductase [bacterium]